jgi:hypothetical protein
MPQRFGRGAMVTTTGDDKTVLEKDDQRGRARESIGSRKRFWLLPFLVVTLLLLAAVLLANGPAIVPFIYRTY